MRKICRYLIAILVTAIAVMIWQQAPQSAISMAVAFLIAVTAIMILYKTPDDELQSAVKRRDVPLDDIRSILRSGASLKSRDKDGRTPLILAASRSPSIEIVSYLIDSGSDIEARDNDGNTPLIAGPAQT